MERAIGGRFSSHAVPERRLIESVAEDLATGLTGQAADRENREWAALEEFYDRH